MKQRLARSISGIIIAHPGRVAWVLVLLTALSLWRTSQLTVNYNQIELIPQDLPSVVATQKMLSMVNSVGFLLMPLKGKDLNHTKQVSDELAKRLTALPEIRKVTYKQDTEFIKQRVPLFVATKDLKEAYKRIRKKLRAVIAKNNPFQISLRAPSDEPLDLSDIIQKYRRMNKKDINDPYYVDKNLESILLVIKPSGVNTDIDFLKRLMGAVNQVVHDYNLQNTHGAKLVEHYQGFAPGATVTYGYTGSFKRNLDDSETMKAAIIPTSGFAFAAILLYLLFVLRRPSQVALIMFVLLMCVVMSFAFCEVVVGELNTVTVILAAILMGLGIDYGIHFMFRLREEFTKTGRLHEAIAQTIEHSGAASIGCSTTTAAALYVLAFSDFKGFADFGLITGTGVLVSFVVMYVAIPTFYILVDRRWPQFKQSLRSTTKIIDDTRLRNKPFPYAVAILCVTLVVTAVLLVFARGIAFDYDSRSLMAVNRPSVVLQEEIGKRWGTSSDPVGIYTETLGEARALYDHLVPIADASNIDAVVSLFTLVPPKEQQEANKKIMQKLEKKLAGVDKNMLDDPKLIAHYDSLMELLRADPFDIEDLPEALRIQFRPVKSSPYKGYLTFIYPKTSLWDGEELVAFANEVGSIDVNGKTYHGAGVSVVFAQLAQIVLDDGTLFTLISALAIFLIAWIDFRSIRGAMLAMLPLIAGLGWMLGLMALCDWRINFMNIVVFPLVFGYGISAGVHLYHRYIESDSVMIALRHTGGAVAASSLTTLIGWAALLVSSHRGLSSMGLLACFGIASTLLVSLTVLPALLQVARKGRTMAPRSLDKTA